VIAALGDRARCCQCGGTAKVVFDVDDEQEKPYDPAKAGAYDPELVASCWGCDEGSRVTPSIYQDFKFQFVVGWGKEWRMPRAEIEAWFDAKTGETR
jgi:hypothetical protein